MYSGGSVSQFQVCVKTFEKCNREYDAHCKVSFSLKSAIPFFLSKKIYIHILYICRNVVYINSIY